MTARTEPAAGGRGAVAAEAHRAERARRKARQAARRAALFRVARGAVRRLPLPVAAALGEALGLLVWAAVPWMRRQTVRNLDTALGAETTARERRRIARRCYGLAGRGLVSWLVLHRMGPERALARAETVFSPEVRAILDSAEGAILLTQHSGLFELSGAWAGRHVRGVAVGRDSDGDPATSMLIRMREDLGLRTIEQGSPREVVRALREGKRVAMLADQDIRGVNGAFVPFFCRPTHTPLGPAAMAVRMRLPILHSVIEWTSLTTHRIRCETVLRAREDLAGEEAVLELTARCSAAIEAAVRRRPAEWLWMHERWRTRPEDVPDAPVWPRSAP